MSVYTIYRYVYNNETIYVGKTKRNLKLRVSEHSIEDKLLPYLDECKIEFFDAGNRQSMDIYEKYLINEMSPILNVVDKENANFDLWCYILKGDYNKIEKVADRVMVDASFEIATGKCYDATEEILENGGSAIWKKK